MEPEPAIPAAPRHKCSACYKQYKLKEHLIEHMKESWHSIHQPKCGVCKKYCKTLESVREHLTGPLAKSNCREVFSALGCDLCLLIFDCVDALMLHKATCYLTPPSVPELPSFTITDTDMWDGSDMEILSYAISEDNDSCPKLVALDCEMVGGGTDGTLDACARVCLVDENEEVIFHSYVKPVMTVTDYRYEITGITEDHLADAPPVGEVQNEIERILRNGEKSQWRMRSDRGKACILIGHDLIHDIASLNLDYPDNLHRDTATYTPLLKTNSVKHSLKYLTKTYLGYEIQSGVHNPYEDAVAAMRLYKRICSIMSRHIEGVREEDNNGIICYSKKRTPFDVYKKSELLGKSPDELLAISRCAYKCWCMDARRVMRS